MGYEIVKRYENTWSIEEEGVRFFLLAGSKEALLIDSGMETKNAREIAETLTDLPLKYIVTHADMDHIGSHQEFDTFYMHPAEAANYYGQGHKEAFEPVWENQIIDLGDRPVKIVHIPGHTEGSIGILDMKNRVLISGDPIQDGRIFMFGPHREIHAYVKGLEHLKDYVSEFDMIFPSHGTLPVPLDMIDTLIDEGQKIIAGDYTYTDTEFFGTPLKLVDVGAASFLLGK